MLWLGNPPYLRWSVAVMVLAATLMWEVSGRETEPFPFARNSIERGQPITAGSVEWRQIPVGMLDMPDLGGAAAVTRIAEGEPIVQSLVAGNQSAADGTWGVPLTLPIGVPRGSNVRLVFADGTSTDATIIEPAREDSFGMAINGIVAVDESIANAVALAASNDDLVVLVEP